MYVALADVMSAVRQANALPSESFFRSSLPLLTHSEEMDELLCSSDWRFGKLRMVRAGQPIPSHETHDCNGKADMRVVWKLFGDGASIVLHSIEERLPQLSRLCRQISTVVNGPSWVNAYISPPNAGAFARHADDHNVLVQQICGQKNWLVTPSPKAEDADNWRPRLDPGDVLYLPRGRSHEASSDHSVSVHLSIGFRRQSLKDVMMSALDERSTLFSEFEVPLVSESFRALELAIADVAIRPWSAATSFGLLQEIELHSMNSTTILQVLHTRLPVEITDHFIHIEKDGRVVSLPRALEMLLTPLFRGIPVRLSSFGSILDPGATLKLAKLLVREEIATASKVDGHASWC